MLRIGAFHTFGPVIVQKILQHLAAHGHMLDLQLIEGDQRDILDRLRSNAIDLALIYDWETDAEIHRERLAGLVPYVLLARDHPFAGRPALTLAELVDLPMVLLEAPPSEAFFLSLFEAHGVKGGSHKRGQWQWVCGYLGTRRADHPGTREPNSSFARLDWPRGVASSPRHQGAGFMERRRLVRVMLRYMPALVALVCYVYIPVKMYLDVRDFYPKALTELKSEILPYSFFFVIPGVLIFIISAKWRIFKWVQLALLLLITACSAKDRFSLDAREECWGCFGVYVFLAAITWPAFFLAAIIAAIRWDIKHEEKGKWQPY